MKKLTLSLLALSGLLLASCNNEPGKSTATSTYATCNMIFPLTGEEGTMSAGYYTFFLDRNEGLMTVSTDNLRFDNTDHKFASNPVTLEYPTAYQLFMTGVTADASNGVMAMSNGTFFISPYQFPNDFDPTNVFTPAYKNANGQSEYIPGTIFYPSLNGNISPLIVSNYKLGNEYMVRTFICDAFYTGDTTTSYMFNGVLGTNSSKTTIYRVIMDIQKKKAGIVLYNAKFSAAPQEPVKEAIYLPDLDIKITTNGYEITGTDIVPLVPEGTSYFPNPDGVTPMPSYTFKSFKMVTTNTWMTDVMMQYQVNNPMDENSDYNGLFSGSYLTLPEKMKGM